MLEFCGAKGIKQEFSNARTPQQNGAEAVNTACYTFNRVRVTKPRNKTPYELLFGHNTLSPLGKFDGKSDEGFLVGYSVNKQEKVFDVSPFSANNFEYSNRKQTPLSSCEPDQKDIWEYEKGFSTPPPSTSLPPPIPSPTPPG
ncbi:ribonuclease H-like domain-containing protein [Tanacetum coccineum]